MNFKKLSLFTCSILCFNSTISEAKKTFPFAKQQEKVSKLETLEQKIAYAKSVTAAAVRQKSPTFGSLAKTTATKSRIVGYTYRYFSFPSPNDTAKIVYSSPNRGGDISGTEGRIKYDSVIAYTFDETSLKLKGDYISWQTFDSKDNVLTYTEKRWDDTKMAYENSFRTSNTYDVLNNLISEVFESWSGVWKNENKRKINYNAAKQILNDSNFIWNSSSWENSAVTTNTYNTSGAIIKTTVSAWFTTAWLVIGTVDYTYDASGFLTQVLSKSINSSLMLVNDSRTTYTNDASGKPLIENTEAWNIAGAGSWVNQNQTINQYDASKQLIVTIAQHWNVSASKFDTVNQNRYTYNSYGQLKTEAFDTLNLATKNWIKQDSNTYYYEEHSPTSIKETTQSNNVKVYPIPTNSEVTIEANLTTAQNVQIVFSDIQGRILLQTNQNSSADYNQKISVENLPSGHYILSINGDKGFSAVQKIEIVH